MNELIKIEVRNNQQLVSGRELHKFLEVGTEYMKWFKGHAYAMVRYYQGVVDTCKFVLELLEKGD